MFHLLETYEQLTEQLEELIEKFDEAIPPWPHHFYSEAFDIRKETSRLLRILRHFRPLTESLAKSGVSIAATGAEARMFDVIYDRAMGVEETTETSLETIRDLIDMHLDTVSHDMNRAMRLIAIITCIVAIPSVIGALLGMNLIDAPWSLKLWQVTVVSVSLALLLVVYFYRKGWLKKV